MKNKKFLSLLIALSMLFSMIQIPSHAAMVAGADKAKIKLVALVPDSNAAHGYKVVNPASLDLSSAGSGDEFYMGIQVEGLKNIEEAATNNLGITQIAFAFTYDTNIVLSSKASNPFRTFQKTTLPSSANTGVLYENDDGYAYQVTNSQVDNVSGEIQYNLKWDGIDDAIKTTYVPDDDELIAVMPFTIKNVPENGATVFGFSTDNKAYCLDFGLSNETGYRAYQLPNDTSPSATPSTDVKDILNVIDFDLSGADVFPITYNVEFYGTYDDKTDSSHPTYSDKLTGKDISMKSGESVNSKNNASPAPSPAISLPGLSDIPTSAVPSGKFFQKWQYIDPTTKQAVDFDENTVISSSMFADGETTLKVFAVYGNGYTVNFDPNYSSFGITSAPASTTKPVTVAPPVSPDTTVEIPTDKVPVVGAAGSTPTPDIEIPSGYKFQGWYDQSGTTEYTFGTGGDKFNNNATVYAKWAEGVTITFYNNDGTGNGHLGTSQQVIVSKDVQFDGTAPDNPTRQGYKFAGWNTEPNGSGTTYADKSAVEAATFSADTKLYAQWTPDGTKTSYTVTFNPVMSGLTANPSTVSVNSGDTIYDTMIPKFDVQGYTLLGWYKEAALSNNEKLDFANGYAPTGDITAYAHWQYTGSNPVTVTFKNPDGTTTYTTMQVAPNSTIANTLGASALPAGPTKAGHAFKEWNTTVDGNGGTKFDENYTIGTTDITVYPLYAQDVTIKYDANGGDDSGLPQPTTHPAADAYTDAAAPMPHADGYTFVGWNTKQNGSGAYITSSVHHTYGDVLTASGSKDGTVTLYAQWAAVPLGEVQDVIGGNPADPDPTQQGVKVTFDDNVPVNTNSNLQTGVSPKYKYPSYGKAIGDVNMPTVPTRNNYTFKEWNTKADGSGVPVSGTTVFNTDTLGAELAQIAGTSTSYEITLYAQWEISDDYVGDRRTITFHQNKNGKGDTDADQFTKVIVDGDVLGYVPTATNGYYDLNGWYEQNASASQTAGKIVFDVAKPFTASTNINADVTYYAKWDLSMVAVIEPMDTNPDDANFVGAYYKGQEIEPKYTIYKNTYPNGSQGAAVKGDKIAEHVVINSSNNDFAVTYTKDGSTGNQTVKDVGVYTPTISIKSGSTYDIMGAKFDAVVADDKGISVFTVKEKQLTVKVDPDTQTPESDTTVAKPTVVVEGLINTDLADDVYKIKYYSWTDDSGNDGKIQTSELGNPIQDTSENNNANPTAAGKYVMKVVLEGNKSANYELSKIESLQQGKQVKLYDGQSYYGTVYPDYPEVTGANAQIAQNIVFEILDSDASADSLTAETVIQPSSTASPAPTPTVVPADLKDSTYKTSKTFNNDKNSTDNTYYIMASKDATDVKLSITPKNTSTTVDVQVGGVSVPMATEAPATGDIDTTVATVTLDSNSANLTTASVIMTSGNNTKTYTIIIKKSQAGIKLNYGNSPYGEIMKATNITDKQAAKDAFDTENKFTTQYLPTGCSTDVIYQPLAWNTNETSSDKPTDSSVNLDRNPYAYFVYQGEVFTDPGIEVVDALGDAVTSPDITMTMTVKQMSSNDVTQMSDTKVTNVIVSNNTSISSTSFADIAGMYIRPDIYELKYSYTDTLTGDVVTATRKVVMLWTLGDANLSAVFNPSDASYMTQIIKRIATPLDAGNEVTGVTRCLYYYRIIDMNLSGVFNPTDPSYATQTIKRIASTVRLYK